MQLHVMLVAQVTVSKDVIQKITRGSDHPYLGPAMTASLHRLEPLFVLRDDLEAFGIEVALLSIIVSHEHQTR